MSEYTIITYGNVPGNIIEALKRAVDSACRVREFHGEKPEIHLSGGMFIFPNGQEIPACYEFDTNRARFGLLTIGSSVLCKAGLSLEQALSAYVGHEMTHHFQDDRKDPRIPEIIALDTSTRESIGDHPLEKEANKTGEMVVKNLYNLPLNWIK